MRTAAFAATILLSLAACSTTPKKVKSAYDQPNDLMAVEIERRVEQIPYLHREELLENLLWLSQTGEQTIPALLEALDNESPKVRSSAAWVLGRIRDRRTIPALQTAMNDSEPTVRFEIARTLVLLGDLEPAPTLIEGLDSERKEVRYLCHEALKSATGHDFGFDHLAMNQQDMQQAVLQWRRWWSDYSGDAAFAMSYEREHGLNQPAQPAQPMGETQPTPNGQPEPDQPPATGSEQSPQPEAAPNGQNTNEQPMPGGQSDPATTPGAPGQPKPEGSASTPILIDPAKPSGGEPKGSGENPTGNEKPAGNGQEIPVVEIENAEPKSTPTVVPVPIPVSDPVKPGGGNGQ